MKIKIFSSFCDSENCKNVYERLCETHLMPNYGKDNEIYIVERAEAVGAGERLNSVDVSRRSYK